MKICGAATKRSAAPFRAEAERREQAAIFASPKWPHSGHRDNESRGKEPPIFSRAEQRAIVIEALGILPNYLAIGIP